jgi:hypothetical protein
LRPAAERQAALPARKQRKSTSSSPRAYLLIGKIDEQTGAAYFLIYFFDEKIGKRDEKV